MALAGVLTLLFSRHMIQDIPTTCYKILLPISTYTITWIQITSNEEKNQRNRFTRNGNGTFSQKNHIAIGIWLCLEKKSFPLSKVSYDMNAKNSFVINRSVKLYNPHLALNSLTFSKKLIGCEEYAMAYMNISLIP